MTLDTVPVILLSVLRLGVDELCESAVYFAWDLRLSLGP